MGNEVKIEEIDKLKITSEVVEVKKTYAYIIQANLPEVAKEK